MKRSLALTTCGSILLLGMGLHLWGQSEPRPPAGTRRDQQDLANLERRLQETIRVVGHLESSNVLSIRSEAGGSRRLLSCVADGAEVKKGDLLIELDDSEVREELLKAEAELQQAESLLIQAERKLEAQRKSGELEMRAATLAMEVAQAEAAQAQALMEAELAAAQGAAALAKRKLAALESAGSGEQPGWTRFEWELDVQRAESQLRILNELQHPLREKKLKLALEQARAAAAVKEAERVERLAASEELIVTRRLSNRLAQGNVERVRKELAACRIMAPRDGVVLYASESAAGRTSDPVLDPGSEIKEGQALLQMPELGDLHLVARVHESLIARIKQGQAARIEFDALPGKTFRGVVESIARHSSTGTWPNYDLREIETTIKLMEPADELRPGISGIVEIQVGRE